MEEIIAINKIKENQIITKDATAFMVNLDKENNWKIYDKSESIFDEKSGLTIQFYKYKREDVKNEK